MQEFNFTKKGVNFKFRNPELNEYNKLVLEYKIEGIDENSENDGYFSNAEFLAKEKAVKFYQVKIKNKLFNAVKLPDEVYEKLNETYENLIEERNKKINKVVKEIINGKMLIDFSIVGCDWPCYQAWLNNLPKDLKGQEQNIMEKAITDYYKQYGINSNIFFSNSCEFLKEKLDKIHRGIITENEEISNKITNVKLDRESQKYHGFKKTVITGFQVKLSDLINKKEIKMLQEEAEKEMERKEKMEKERKSLSLKILKNGQNEGSDGTDFYTIVQLTNPETGETLKFNCRNVFDVGYVINPEYEIEKGIKGGMVSDDKWQAFDHKKGWHSVRKLTEFEKKCIDYLHRFPPLDTEARL